MTAQHQSSLLGYALLKASFDFGNNHPLDALLPIIDRALLNHPNGPIDPTRIQRSIYMSIGLEIPINVIRYTFPKLRKKQRVALIEYIYHANNNGDQLSDVLEIEKKSREVFSRAIDALRPLLLGTRFENDHPSQLLEDWLDNSAVSFVGDKTRYAAVSSSDRELNWLFRECMEGPSGDQFIDDLSYLAVGDVLFRAIRNLTEFEDGADDLPDLPAKMQRVKVFLDTRLILRCLGIGRAELVQATSELTSMCRNTGCQLYCFEHTSDEVKGAIERAADRLRFGGDIGDDIHIWARSEGMGPSDLFEFAAKTAEEIEKLGFAVEAAPDIDEKTHFDEAALETRLEQAMLRQTDHARVADIRSISGIYHLRGSAPVMFLERCSAILITTNKPLADESQRYFRDHYREMGLRHRVQLCMTDNVFATRLWTKLPTKIKQTPRDQIIAHIYGNLEPSRKVLDGFTSFLGRVRDTGKISEEQFERVRLSRFARDIIAMETRNTTESPSTAENIAIYKKIVERDGELEAENRSLERDLSKEKERSKTLAEEIELLRAELEEAARQENSPTSDIEISEEDRIQAVDALRRIEEKQQAQARRITIRSGIVGLSRTTKVLVGISLTGIIVALGVSTISPVAAFAHEKLVQVRLIDPASGMDLESFRSLVVQVSGATGLFFGAAPIIAHFFKKK